LRVGVISVFTDYHRRGRHHRGALQPQVGRLIAALLPEGTEIDVVNDTWTDPDWERDYDLLFLSCLHSDFDRARQISHYWRRRGAKTVLGGSFASMYRELCRPYFDAVAVGDPESLVPRIYADFCRGALEPLYIAEPSDAPLPPPLRLDLAADQQVLPLAIEATRGCPFTCEFCALTGLGTRFHARPAELAVRDIVEGRRMLQDRAAAWQHHVVIFYDNNFGGHPRHMRGLCEALAPLRIRWGACVTFNVVSDPENLRALAKGGCRAVFVGLESFNPAAIAEMGKHQNILAKTRAVVDMCRDHGILMLAGLMLSPVADGVDYIDRIPQHLRDAGLHVPTYICFETPFPGTPHFRRLAASGDGAFIPNALLRDFNGYTLVTRPRHAAPEEFVEAYKRCHRAVYSPRARLAKLLDDVPRFVRGGWLVPVLFDLYELVSEESEPVPGRTFITGTDIAPPETVPFSDADFTGEEERDSILLPWAVADRNGRALAQWLDSRRIYPPKGRGATRGAAQESGLPNGSPAFA
jgi:hypothetical protein